MVKPVAVCISDIHFNLNTLPLASAALQAAIDKATQLNIPVIVAGDLHDTKSIIRGEVANRLIEILGKATCDVYIIVGNHDLLNEKGEDHGLNYLKPYANIVERPEELLGRWLIPYHSNKDELITFLNNIPKKGSTLIMHQGFMGAAMGDYVQDKTSIDPLIVKDFTVISGHYHRHQKLGTVTYIGSPYTMSFGEANDGPKGFLVLNSNGSFTREILNLRKHVIVERNVEDLLRPEPSVNPDDLLWVKVRGPKSELDKIRKADVGNVFLGHNNFKLDLIPNDSAQMDKEVSQVVTNEELFDSIIDAQNESQQYKEYLKRVWRELV